MRSRGRASTARSRPGARWRPSARSRRSCSRTGSAPASPPGSFAGTATTCVTVLTQDPYQLVELPRVGFKIADGVARSLGVELDDPQRLQAGLRFVLDEAESDGNTFLPLAELWQRAGRRARRRGARSARVCAACAARGGRGRRRGRPHLPRRLWEIECRFAEMRRRTRGRGLGRAVRRAGAARRSRSPTSSGPSSSSCARGRSCSSPAFRAQGRRTRSALSSRSATARASVCCSARRPGRRRGGCAT